jgi:hypothetical protein
LPLSQPFREVTFCASYKTLSVKMRKSHSEHFSTAVPQKADVVLTAANGSFVAMKRREQVQRNCQCASTSRQKTHQAKADRAPRFRQCLIIAPRSSTCRVELHWRLGPGANHGRMARIAEAWDRSTAPGATSRSTISSASIRLQRLRLACRSGAQLIPILATRYGWARPGHACLWTDILNPL